MARLFLPVRPPYGYYNNTLIETCEELGISCIEWSVDSLDWKGLSGSELSGRVISKTKAGSISSRVVPSLKLLNVPVFLQYTCIMYAKIALFCRFFS